jgi:hypothetical protein
MKDGNRFNRLRNVCVTTARACVTVFPIWVPLVGVGVVCCVVPSREFQLCDLFRSVECDHQTFEDPVQDVPAHM